jgi:outer membrane protein insertion porin family
MRSPLRFCALLLLVLLWVPAGWSQYAAPPKIVRIDVKHIGPPSASDDLVRSNLRVKAGDPYLRAAVDDDVRNLYATGFFYNIQVTAEEDPSGGVVLVYKVQGKPHLTAIRFQGNTKFKDSKLLKTISSKPGDLLDERKLFTDTQDVLKLYQKKGYPKTEVKYALSINEPAGQGTAVFQISECPKIKILEVDFVGAKAFTQRKLRHQIKTRKHWWLSWLTGSGHFKDDVFDEDREKLTTFYREQGYIDFEIKDVQFVNPTPQTMVIRFIIYEGTQYKIGSVKFSGNKLFATPQLTAGLRQMHERSRSKAPVGTNGLPMDVGSIFTAEGLTKDSEAVSDFYGTRGYLDVRPGSRGLNVVKVPNTERSTMDLEFQLEEGQQSYIEKIQIHGNTKTKDRVVRRELAVAPGELFDMVRVKLSKARLENLGYFERVDTRPESSDAGPNRKDLIVDVEEKTTGHVSLGAGFSTVDSLVGTAEYNEADFNLSHPFEQPWFRGGGQKLRLRATVGTVRQDYELTFIEPWFLDRKLTLNFDLYYRDYAFLSPNDLYDESRGGGKIGLESALFGNENLRGSVNYTLDTVGISLTSEAIQPSIYQVPVPPPGIPILVENPGNVPPDILSQVGHHLESSLGSSLSWDTRNSYKLPDKGQRTSLSGQIMGGPLGGQVNLYKVELQSAHYFRGFAKGHVLEIGGRAGVAQAFGSTEDVPFFERYYLGGPYSLRGFKYHYVSPRQLSYNEPVGGDTYWFGSAEYSIPIFEQEKGIGVRFAVFYDIGSVGSDPYDFNVSNYSDNWGLGLRLNLPIGPLRLDYGVPIKHDQYNSSSGQFQFGVGWTRQF